MANDTVYGYEQYWSGVVNVYSTHCGKVGYGRVWAHHANCVAYTSALDKPIYRIRITVRKEDVKC